MTTDSPTPALAEAINGALGKDAANWEPVVGGGYTRQAKWRVHFADGSTAFVKAAREEPYSSALRREVGVYKSVDGSFLPRLIGALDDGAIVVLAVEDLADAHWPPPYPGDVRPLFEALDAVAATPAPEGLRVWSVARSNWREIAENPEPFLALALCSGAWLEQVAESLVEAESRAHGRATTSFTTTFTAEMCASLARERCLLTGTRPVAATAGSMSHSRSSKYG